MRPFAKIFMTISVDNKLPYDWTETKVPEDTFVREIPQAQKDLLDLKDIRAEL
jgi:hypothetical protein